MWTSHEQLEEFLDNREKDRDKISMYTFWTLMCTIFLQHIDEGPYKKPSTILTLENSKQF